MDKKDEKHVNYMLFYEYYLAYANRNCLSENSRDHGVGRDKLGRIYEALREFLTKKPSIAIFLDLPRRPPTGL
jgi:hypothetical protein